MKRLLTAACALLLVVAGCGSEHRQRNGIVVTTNILGDITRNIVGDAAAVTVLMKPNADPHSFAISAQEAARLETAALVVHNGLGLEEGVLRHVHAAEQSGVPALSVGDRINPISYTADDVAGRPDPHFWTDPKRVRRAAEVISERVIEHVDGIDADAIRANTTRYLSEIDRLDSWMGERFAAIPAQRRKLVTNHHVFGYLAQRFGFQIVGAVIPSGTTLASPSASDLASLADAVRAAGGGAATYLETTRANTEAIVRGLAHD